MTRNIVNNSKIYSIRQHKTKQNIKILKIKQDIQDQLLIFTGRLLIFFFFVKRCLDSHFIIACIKVINTHNYIAQ